MPSSAKKFFTSILSNLWNDIVQDDDEELTREKVIDILTHFHFKCKEFFHFEVRKKPISVTEGMHICRLTACKLFGTPRCLGHAVKVAQ